MNTQNIINTGLILTMIATWTFIGLTDESGSPLKDPNYYCESEETKAYCFEIRDYSDKVNYRCLYDETNLRRYYSCSSGWKEIPLPEKSYSSKQTGKQWICDSNSCTAIE